MSKKSILFFLLFSIVSFSYCINAFGPYLQCPTRTSIRVLWKTDLPTESIIAIGKEPNKWDSIYTFSSKKMYHKVEFVGLEPNTKYYYAQMENGKVLPNKQGEGYFTTLPLEAKPIPFRVWCLGDFGKATEQQRAVRLSFEAYNKDNPTNFWIWLGDNAYQYRQRN
jgi:phosphodiesterase/alkaline phosphatase D-like protein